MNKVFLIALSLFIITFTSCNSGDSVKLENKLDSASYALGVSLGSNLSQSGLKELNYEIMMAAMKKALAKDSNLLINNENANILLQSFFQELQMEASKKDLEVGEKWLKENAKKEGVVVTQSGLQYKVIKEGTGVKPVATDKVSVHYTGKLTDGTVFDSSIQRGEPASFEVGGVIPGWTEALLLMPVGSKWELYIPSQLAYGERGAGGIIKPNSVLVFEVELLQIVPADAKEETTDKK